MSIALSVVVHPSRNLQIIAGLFSTCLIVVAASLAGSASIQLSLRLVLVAVCLATAIFNFFALRTVAGRKWQLQIGAAGGIHCNPLPLPDEVLHDSGSPINKVYYLAPGTVIWPHLLIIRLRRLNDDNMINLVVLSDAVGKDDFRRLAIACRWIIAQANSDLK